MYAEVVRAQSFANHVQHIVCVSSAICCVSWREKGQLSYICLAELMSHSFDLYSISWNHESMMEGRKPECPETNVPMSFRKCHKLKPEKSSPKWDSNPHPSTGGRCSLGKQTCWPLHHTPLQTFGLFGGISNAEVAVSVCFLAAKLPGNMQSVPPGQICMRQFCVLLHWCTRCKSSLLSERKYTDTVLTSSTFLGLVSGRVASRNHLYSSWDLNSGPYSFKADTLTGEPSKLLTSFAFSKN